MITDTTFARAYGPFIFHAVSSIQKGADTEAPQMIEILPLWIMYDNLQAPPKWLEMGDPFQGVWIMHELLSFIFAKSELIMTYKIPSFPALATRKKWSWWLLYLGGHYLLQTQAQAQTHNLLPHGLALLKVLSWEETLDARSSMITALDTKKYAEFIDLLPSPLEPFERTILSRMIKSIFCVRALDVGFDPIDPISIYHSRKVSITLTNTSDLIFYDVEFSVMAHPTSSMSVEIEEAPRSTIFDTTMQLTLKITGNKAHNNGKVTLMGHFRSLFTKTPPSREKMLLQEFIVEIKD